MVSVVMVGGEEAAGQVGEGLTRGACRGYPLVKYIKQIIKYVIIGTTTESCDNVVLSRF